jgi:hypothetical protein
MSEIDDKIVGRETLQIAAKWLWPHCAKMALLLNRL